MLFFGGGIAFLLTATIQGAFKGPEKVLKDLVEEQTVLPNEEISNPEDPVVVTPEDPVVVTPEETPSPKQQVQWQQYTVSHHAHKDISKAKAVENDASVYAGNLNLKTGALYNVDLISKSGHKITYAMITAQKDQLVATNGMNVPLIIEDQAKKNTFTLQLAGQPLKENGAASHNEVRVCELKPHKIITDEEGTYPDSGLHTVTSKIQKQFILTPESQHS